MFTTILIKIRKIEEQQKVDGLLLRSIHSGCSSGSMPLGLQDYLTLPISSMQAIDQAEDDLKKHGEIQRLVTKLSSNIL